MKITDVTEDGNDTDIDMPVKLSHSLYMRGS